MKKSDRHQTLNFTHNTAHATRQNRVAQRRRIAPAKAAFTLVELLAVIAIIALIGAVVLAINAEPSQSLSNAQNSANTIFRSARQKSQSPNPDRSPAENPLYNIRSRVIILKDPKSPEEHLRLIRVLVGGTRRAEDTKPENYFWYDTEIQYILPKGVFMVDDTAKVAGKNEGFPEERRSRISNNDNTGIEMKKDYKTSKKAQAEGEGDRTWYFYEFNNDGTSNMTAATFIIAEGSFLPNTENVVFKNIYDIAGLYVTPSGETILYSDALEMDKSNVSSAQ